MAKLKKGKRRSSKREKRQLRKRHKEDKSTVAAYHERILLQKAVPQWEEMKAKDIEYNDSLSKKDKRFLAVQRALGVIPNVRERRHLPIPALVEKKEPTPAELEQKAMEERRRNQTKHQLHNKDQTNHSERAQTEQSKQDDEPALYDLWGDAKPKRKRTKTSKNRTESATRLLNTMLPHPGQSYNPDVRSYQKALSAAARTEAKKVLKEEKILKKLNPDSKDPNVISGGHDALDGLKSQEQALQREARLTESDLKERQAIQEELKRLHENNSQPKPLLARSRLVGRKVHKIQLARKKRKVYERFHKKLTVEEELEEAHSRVGQLSEREKRRRLAKRQNRELQHSRAFASVVDAKDVLLPEEMPTRLSSMGQNTTALLSSRLRSLGGTKKHVF